MKLLVLSRPNSERARPLEEFLHEFTRRHPGIPVKEVNIDTRDGAATAVLYDITDAPGLVATADDGGVLEIWQGEFLPLMDQVAGYAV